MARTRRLLLRGAAPGAAAALAGCLLRSEGHSAAGGRRDAAAWGAAPPPLRSGARLAFLNPANRAAGPLVEGVLEAWRREQPGIAVEWLRPDGEATLAAMLAAGSPPDVFAADQNALPAAAHRGDALALDALLRRDAVDLTDYVPAGLGLGQLDGRQHGLPRAFNPGVLCVNLSRFEAEGVPGPPPDWGAAGWGWDEFLAAARRLSAPGGAPGEARYGADLLGGLGFFWAFVHANGGELFDAGAAATRIAEPPAVEALQFLADLIHRHRVHPAPEARAALGNRDVFLRGLAAMHLTGASNATLYQEVDGFRWDWRPLPAGRAGAADWGGGFTWAVAARSGAREEAWALLKHLTSAASATALAGVYFPARRAAVAAFLEAEARAGRPPASRQLVLGALQRARVRPNHPRADEVQAVLDEELGRLWREGGPARAAADAIRRRADPILPAR